MDSGEGEDKRAASASVCTGIYGLAATGLLDGRHVTTHWRFAADVAKRFPKLRMEPNALFVKEGSSTVRRGLPPESISRSR